MIFNYRVSFSLFLHHFLQLPSVNGLLLKRKKSFQFSIYDCRIKTHICQELLKYFKKSHRLQKASGINTRLAVRHISPIPLCPSNSSCHCNVSCQYTLQGVYPFRCSGIHLRGIADEPPVLP